MSKVFQEDINKDSCVKISKIEHCVSLCYSKTSAIDNSIFNGLQVVKQEICENDQDNKVTNKCVDKHKYLLLSCVHESFNLNAVSPEANLKLLMCRKVSEAQQCDLSTLVPCSRHANYNAEVLLKKLFRPLRSEFCTFERKEIYSLNVTYPVLSNDYKNLALCFDINSHLLDECVPDKLTTPNSIINSFFTYKLCRAVESFVDCMYKVVQQKCHNEKTIFKSISQTLYQHVLPKCFPFSVSNSAAKGAIPTNSKNASDMDRIQHVINVEHHSSSAKKLMHSFAVDLIYIFLVLYIFMNTD